jgi:hypothetical protein
MEDVMNRACDTYWGGNKCIFLVRRPFERCRVILWWILNRMKGNGQDSFSSG